MEDLRYLKYNFGKSVDYIENDCLRAIYLYGLEIDKKSFLKENASEIAYIEGKLPIVIMHRTQKNENGKRIAEADDFVFLRLKDFLDILDDGKIIKKCLDKKTKM